MGRKRVTTEQIITKLRKAEILLAEGKDLDQVVKIMEVHKQTYYRWKREYGGLQMDQAKRLKELEKENSRLKKVVADLALDNSVLKEVAQGNF